MVALTATSATIPTTIATQAATADVRPLVPAMPRLRAAALPGLGQATLTVDVSRPDRSTVPGVAPVRSSAATISTPLT